MGTFGKSLLFFTPSLVQTGSPSLETMGSAKKLNENKQNEGTGGVESEGDQHLIINKEIFFKFDWTNYAYQSYLQLSSLCLIWLLSIKS